MYGQSANESKTTPSKFNFGKKADDKIEDYSELENQTIKEILESWEKEMNEQIEAFHKRAKLVKRCDRSIYECLDLLLHLDGQIQALDDSQESLNKAAKDIISEQEDFLRQLDNLDENGDIKKEPEKKASSFTKTAQESSKPKKVIDKNNQRYKLYEKASKLGKKLHKMSMELDLIKDENEKWHKKFYSNDDSKEKEDDIDKIKKIANCHLNAMRYVDKQADELEKRLDYLLYQLRNE